MIGFSDGTASAPTLSVILSAAKDLRLLFSRYPPNKAGWSLLIIEGRKHGLDPVESQVHKTMYTNFAA